MEEKQGWSMTGDTIFVLDGSSGQANSTERVDLIQSLGDFGFPFCGLLLANIPGTMADDHLPLIT